MTDQITVPRETWDALISALENHPGNYKLTTLEAKVYQTIITRAEALTAANAVSAEPKVKLIPTAEEMGTPVQPQAQDGVFGWLLTNGTFTSSEAEQISHDCRNTDKAIALYAHPQATEPASCHQTGVCVRSGLAAENHARLIECARRLVEHADFALGGILSADSKAKDIPSKAVSQVKSRHLAALRDALPAAPEAKQ